MQETFRDTSNIQSLTLEENSAISEFERDSTSIFSRRIQTGIYILKDVVPSIGKHLTWGALADNEHAYFSIFPKHEKPAVVERRRKFGTPFPGLYSLSKRPVGINRSVGPVNIFNKENPTVLMGDPKGKSVLITACAFDIERDARLTICNIGVRSDKNAILRYNYRVYLLFMMAFGDLIQPFDTSSILEDQVVRFFRENSHKEISA